MLEAMSWRSEGKFGGGAEACVFLTRAMSAAASSSTTTPAPVNRHAMTAAEIQRAQLARLLKDPSKPAFVPEAAKPKSVRAPREMMKNVQGSSAGAGSGEFHVYKANRRREYERLKIMEEEVEQARAPRAGLQRASHYSRRRQRRRSSSARNASATRLQTPKPQRIARNGKRRSRARRLPRRTALLFLAAVWPPTSPSRSDA